MKKIIYIIILSFVSALSITACTEEQVTPSNETISSGGEVSEENKR